MSFIGDLDKKIKALELISKHGPLIAIDIIMENKDIVIGMNVEDQLYLKGIGSDNVPLIEENPYHPFTVHTKTQKGQPVNRVTLRDEEDFHESFKIKRSKTTAEIGATDPKADDLERKYGSTIYGLIQDNENEIRDDYIYPEVLDLIKEV